MKAIDIDTGNLSLALLIEAQAARDTDPMTRFVQSLSDKSPTRLRSFAEETIRLHGELVSQCQRMLTATDPREAIRYAHWLRENVVEIAYRWSILRRRGHAMVRHGPAVGDGADQDNRFTKRRQPTMTLETNTDTTHTNGIASEAAAPRRTRKGGAPVSAATIAELRKTSSDLLEQSGKAQASYEAAVRARRKVVAAELAELDELIEDFDEGDPADGANAEPKRPAKRPAPAARPRKAKAAKTRHEATSAKPKGSRKAPKAKAKSGKGPTASSETVDRVVQAVRDGASTTAEVLGLVTGVPKGRVLVALKAAAAEGKLVPIGKNRGRRYELPGAPERVVEPVEGEKMQADEEAGE